MPQNEMTKLYKSVIEDVIKNVRNDFVNMGVDEQVLFDLQLLWEQKLLDYKVISPSEYFGNIPGHNLNMNMNMNMNVNMSGNGGMNTMIGPNGQVLQGNLNHMTSQPQAHQHQMSQVNNEGGLNVLANGALAASSVPPSDNYGYIRPNNRTTYYHPSQGYFEASSTIAPTAANLPNVAPSTVKNGKNPSSSTSTGNRTRSNKRYDGAGDSDNDSKVKEQQQQQNPDDIIKLLYTNGDEEVILDKVKSSADVNNDTNNENNSLSVSASVTATANQIDENDEINSDLDDDDDEEDQVGDNEGYDESGGPLDENVVLCQYEKVNRTRNKWRCVFKSGIIHVNGIDHVFSKANGEFEW